jgi:hypothetical protein
MEPQPNNYNFILETQKKPSRFSMMSPNSTKGRLIVAGGVVGLIIFLYVVLNAIFGGTPSTLTEMSKLPAIEAEIVRMSSNASLKARSAPASNLAATAAHVLETDRQNIVKYLQSQNIKLTELQARGAKNASNDKLLESAALNNKYDEEYLNYMKTALATYQAELKQQYQSASGENAKKVLNTAYGNAFLLLQELTPTK